MTEGRTFTLGGVTYSGIDVPLCAFLGLTKEEREQRYPVVARDRHTANQEMKKGRKAHKGFIKD